MEEKQMEYLVVDSGAIIRGHGSNFIRLAKNVVTIPEVIDEIRDSKSRLLLESLPYTIDIRHPSEVAMKAVSHFARQTGDFASLSLTDLKVIALSYTLEVQVNGTKNLKEAKDLKVISASSSSKPRKDENSIVETSTSQSHVKLSAPLGTSTPSSSSFSWAAIASQTTPSATSLKDNNNETDVIDISEVSECTVDALCEDQSKAEDDTKNEAAAISITICDNGIDCNEGNNENIGQHIEFSTTLLSALTVEEYPNVVTSALDNTNNNNPCIAEVSPEIDLIEENISDTPLESSTKSLQISSRTHDKSLGTQQISRILSMGGGSSTQNSKKARDEDDGIGWINSSNISSHRGHSQTHKKIDIVDNDNLSTNSVACITTDFSMQNVMMQLGLKLMSVDGMIIRSVKQWVLRCMACYKVHYDMDRLFCSSCGANHLSRVSASIDSKTGKLKLHLKEGYRVNIAGKKYSMPAPGKQNRYEGELLLREDQLLTGIWRQKSIQIRKDVRSHFGEDITSDVGLQLNKSQRIQIGLGKGNPNKAKGRERRGAKHK